MSQPLICPGDSAVLLQSGEDGGLVCPTCAKRYKRSQGVVRLSAVTDEFYEGAYQNQVRYLPKGQWFWQAWPLWLINGGYVWVTRRYVAPASKVVELGCGGGIAYFGQRYQMTGCDLSLSSLERAALVYQTCVQVNVTACIPVPSGSVDAVISSCFWEHLRPRQKDDLLREVRRVLRPSGKVVFLYDVHTRNPLIAKMKDLSAERYQQLFLDKDGHLGYETVQENRERFLDAGLKVLLTQGVEATPILSPSAFEKFGRWGRKTDFAFRLLSRLGQAPWIYPYTALQRSIDAFLGPVLPLSWARMVITVCEGPGIP